MSYKTYIRWRQLSRGGTLSRAQMSAEAQAEFDALGIKEVSMWKGLDLDHEAARRAYEEITKG